MLFHVGYSCLGLLNTETSGSNSSHGTDIGLLVSECGQTVLRSYGLNIQWFPPHATNFVTRRNIVIFRINYESEQTRRCSSWQLIKHYTHYPNTSWRRRFYVLVVWVKSPSGIGRGLPFVFLLQKHTTTVCGVFSNFSLKLEQQVLTKRW